MGLFAENPDYRRYESLLLQLHDLIAADADEGEEGEQVRDVMEPVHWSLSGAERERLNLLSGDLYQLTGREVFMPWTEGVTGASVDALRKSIRFFAQQAMWAFVLSLLRRPSDLPDMERAIWRADAYRALGHDVVADRFAQYAAPIESR